MVFSSRVKGKDSVGRVLAYDNAVREAAVCTSVLHTNIVTTYHYDFKQLETNQQPGQRLEVRWLLHAWVHRPAHGGRMALCAFVYCSIMLQYQTHGRPHASILTRAAHSNVSSQV